MFYLVIEIDQSVLSPWLLVGVKRGRQEEHNINDAVLFYRLLLLACLVLLLSVKKSCELKVVISCFFTCLLVPPTCVCVFVCVHYVCVTWCCGHKNSIQCVLPGVVCMFACHTLN